MIMKGALIGVLRFFDVPWDVKGEAFVEFGERNLDPDFGHGQDRVIEDHVAAPLNAGAGEDRSRDSILLKDDIALDGESGPVLLVFDDAVGAGRAFAEHFENDDGIADKSARISNSGADDKAVGIADVAGGFDLEVTAVVFARFAAQPSAERGGYIGLDIGVSGRSAGHGDRLEAVEFIAQRLLFLPIEEFR